MKRLGFFVVMIFSLLAMSMVGCNTFNEIGEKQLSSYPECVVMLNSGEIYKTSKDKSGTVNPLSACLKSIDRQRCAMEVWGKEENSPAKVDWSDEKKLLLFYKCMRN